jgi:hypothetical protein
MKAKALHPMFFAVALFAFSFTASAHHSVSAEFDLSRRAAMAGIVTKVEWANPHTFFYVDVKDPKTGNVVNWSCELGSPNMLFRLGWTQSTLKVGMMVSFTGNLARDGTRKVNARTVVAEGVSLTVWPSQVATPRD